MCLDLRLLPQHEGFGVSLVPQGEDGRVCVPQGADVGVSLVPQGEDGRAWC